MARLRGVAYTQRVIGARLHSLRKRSGLSGYEAARLCGLYKTHVRLIESGVRAFPEPSTVEKLCRLYGCSPAWLIYGSGNPPNDLEIQKAVNSARGRWLKQQQRER